MATRGGAEDLDVCPECRGPFTDPKFLPCHHTVCAPCIQKIAKRYSKRTFPCPACQKPTSLPRKGVRALQSNVYAKKKTKDDAATTAAVQGDNDKSSKASQRSTKASSPSPRLPKASETPSVENHSEPSLKEKEVEMTVVRQFRCKESKARVFSLYHTEFYLRNGLSFLYVCFERSQEGKGVMVETFYDNGSFVEKKQRKEGEATMKYFIGKNLFYRLEVDVIDRARREALLTYYFFDQTVQCVMELDCRKGTFAKSNDFGLERGSRERTRLVKYTICSQHLTLIHKPYFTINVNRHRAVDVDDAAKVIVVVEEPRTPDGRRTVLMYRCPGGNAVCVYTPSNAQDFQPADVCFFRLNGKDVVLVADEASEDIHVAKIGRTTLTFDRFLHTDCPELRYPTALAVDAQGRLWVACKAGQIVALDNVLNRAKVKSSRSTSFPFDAALWSTCIGFFLLAVFVVWCGTYT